MISNWKQGIGYVNNLDVLYTCEGEVVMETESKNNYKLIGIITIFEFGYIGLI